MSILLNLDTSVQLLIVHPDDRVLRRYLSELIRDNTLLYSRIPGAELDLDSAQEIVFGQYGSIGNYDALPDAYVLDEVDRLPMDVFNELLPFLMQCDPIAIIMFTRTVPPILFEDEMLSKQIQIVSDTGIMSLNDSYTPLIEVSGFGIGRVRINGHDVQLTPDEITHQLFFYLLEHEELSREILIAEFWPHLDKESAIDNFYMTLNRLNAILGIKFLQLTGTHYRISSGIEIQYDVQSFRDIFDNVGFGSDLSHQEAYESAYRLHHHDFLQGINSDWVANTRENLREIQSEICVNYAGMMNSPDKTLGLYARAFRYNPYREDVAHAMMTLYLDSGNPCDALIVYEALNDNLMRRNLIQPGSNLRKLMQQAKAKCKP